LVSEVNLNLPSQVGRKNYEILLVSASPIWSYITSFTVDGQNVTTVEQTPSSKIIAQTTQDPIVKVEFDIPNIDVLIQGKSENGENGVLKYFRYNFNSTIVDTIILGEPDIIIEITEIS
jgi:hypothetical protein